MFSAVLIVLEVLKAVVFFHILVVGSVRYIKLTYVSF